LGRWTLRSIAVVIATLALQSCATRGAVDGTRLASPDVDAAQWMSYGRTWDEQRFSPLDRINDSNVSRLGLVWYDDLETFR
jgi:quinohemoprotein ethanol dehydrogenase